MCSVSGCLIFDRQRTTEEYVEIERKMRKLVLRLPSVYSVQVYEDDDSWTLYAPITGEQHG